VRCVKCKGATKVKDSRSHKDTIRRRRICKKCKHRFFTFEVAEWGVDHAAGVDFDDPDLDRVALDSAIASIGLPPSECL